MRNDAEQEALERLLANDVPAGRVRRYGEDPDQIVEEFGPADGRLLVFVHGGYFRPRVDRTHARPLAADLAGRGYRVLLAEYRRIPGDARATLDDLHALALAAGRAIWVGHSAGGTLALAHALDPALDPGRVVALAPVCDLRRSVADGGGDGAVRDWIGATPQEDPTVYTELDFAERLPGNHSDLTLVTASADRSVPPAYAVDLAAATGAHHRQLDGAHHFDLIDPASPHWEAVVDLIGQHRAESRPLPRDNELLGRPNLAEAWIDAFTERRRDHG